MWSEALLWLLVALPFSGASNTGTNGAAVVERFVSKEECERVAKYIMDNRNIGTSQRAPMVGCIQARVAR